MSKGIDVSSHNGVIDWPKVKAGGIDFAILRAGFGQLGKQKDTRFDANMQGALAAGIRVGVYWFSYAYSQETARMEAQACMEVIKPYQDKLTFPVYFDYEYDSENYSTKEKGVTPTKTLRTDMAVAFCDALAAAGYLPGVYTNLDYIRSRFDMPRLAKYELWLADYTGAPDVACGLQQTGSTGRVAGIATNVDTNVAYKDYGAPQAQYASDTTGTVKIKKGTAYSIKITGQDVPLVAGTDGVVQLIYCRHADYTLWHVVPIGAGGALVGIYRKGAEKICTVEIGG